MERRRLEVILLRLAMAAVSLAAALAVAELATRYFLRGVHSSGDARTYLAARAPKNRLNQLGFREHEIGPKHAFRIVVIGDSFTWGQGIDDEARFSNLIQATLGPSFEVLNFGHPGNDMPHHVRVLDRALRVSPDFVLLQLFINDFELHGMVRPIGRPLLPWAALDSWLLRSSVVYDLADSLWGRLQVETGLTESYAHYLSRYLANPRSRTSRAASGFLREFIDHARAAGVPTGIVLFPNPEPLGQDYPFGYLHQRVKAVCIEQRVLCVDLRGPFAAAFPKAAWMWVSPFDHHPNAAANRVAAGAILDEFGRTWREAEQRTGDGSNRFARPHPRDPSWLPRALPSPPASAAPPRTRPARRASRAPSR